MRARRSTASRLVTNGGRILGVTGLGDDDREPRGLRRTRRSSCIEFRGMRYRTDIAAAAARPADVAIAARSDLGRSLGPPLASTRFRAYR